MEKMCVGEKIHTMYKAFIVALPDNDDDYIRVSYVPVLCISGTFFYDNNTAETLNDYETLTAALTPEWAKKRIPGYVEGMKLSVVYGFSFWHLHLGSRESEDKANQKLHDRLERMTLRDFYTKNF